MGKSSSKPEETKRPASAPAATSRRSHGSEKLESSQEKPDAKPPAQPTKNPSQKSKTEDGGAKIIKEIENTKNSKLMVAAIDFGTTYSGYACMTRADFNEHMGDNSKIHCPTWPRDGGLNYKAPTSVLFRPNKSFHSFGFEAEKFYHDNAETIDFKEWYYFKHFKMKLYTDKNQLTQDTVIEDNREAGNTMKAVDVFAEVIRYFKNHLLKYLETQTSGEGFDNNDIHWVITVPAIWDLKAKQFMKDAAEKAGIKGDQLTLALEPEAASLYCRKVPVSVETTVDGGKAIAAMQKGSKYIVFDQGGGTTDITVHEVTGPDTLREIHQACGGHYGGTTVNAEFFKFLARLFGGPVMHEIRTKHPSEYFDLMTNFENKKTSFNDPSDDKSMVTLRVPIVWMETYKNQTDESLQDTIPSSTFKGQVTVHNDKLRINSKLFMSFFDFSIQNVLKIFENLFKNPQVRDINTILAVGGYSESPVLINAIKKKFPNVNVIVPKDPGLAVLKGAVLYGFEPHSITERVSQYTYGVAMQLPYDPDKHDKRKISSVKGRGGRQMVDDIFDKHIEIGQVSKIGEFQDEHDYFPVINDQKVATFEFYASEEKNPKYTTDDKCQLIGTYQIKIIRDSTKDGKLFLKLNASGTEIIAVVREEKTGLESRAYFSLF